MKENKYDDPIFFEKYSAMNRSVQGLEGAGEWHELKKLLPDFKGKKVLDLGCGFGWHCRYAVDLGAAHVVGVDISQKMLHEAAIKTDSDKIEYICMPIEDIEFERNTFDVVLSSLAFHYIVSFEGLAKKVYDCLAPGGRFIFSVEHPVFTAQGTQDWYYAPSGERLHWPVDRYFMEGERQAVFLGEPVVKYHKTLTTYMNTLIGAGFRITGVVEPAPEPALIALDSEMAQELRRPMMLIVSAVKEA